MNAGEEPKLRRGLLAILQVLGVKGLFEGQMRAPLEEALRHVRETAESEFPAESPEFKPFGGAVILMREFGGAGLDEGAELGAWTGFVRHAASLLRHMFNHGYPMRCAINFGEVPESEPESASGLALQTYDLARQQDWSGGILAPAAARRLWDLVEHQDPQGSGGIRGMVLNYRVPLKSGPKELVALNWGREDSGRIFAPLGPSIRDTVIRAFARHDKAMDDAVMLKAAHTEAFLWHCRENSSRP